MLGLPESASRRRGRRAVDNEGVAHEPQEHQTEFTDRASTGRPYALGAHGVTGDSFESGTAVAYDLTSCEGDPSRYGWHPFTDGWRFERPGSEPIAVEVPHDAMI